MLDDKLMKGVIADYFEGYKRESLIFNICLTAEISLNLLKSFVERKDAELGLSTMKEEDLYGLYLFYLTALDNPFTYIAGFGYGVYEVSDWEGCSTDEIIKYVDELVSREDIRIDLAPYFKWTPSCVKESTSVFRDFEVVAKRVNDLIDLRQDYHFELEIMGTLLERMHILGESLKMCDLRYNADRNKLLEVFYRRYSKMDDIYESCKRIRAKTELYRVQHISTVQ